VAATSVLSEEFAQVGAAAGLRARERALASGYAAVFVDEAGRYVKEMPDGTRFAVQFEPGMPAESHLRVLGEITTRER
jgi:hypothetical protein